MIVLENADDNGWNYFGIMYELTGYYKVIGEEEEDKAIYLLGKEREGMIGRPSHPKENERGNDYQQLFCKHACTDVCIDPCLCTYVLLMAHNPCHGHCLYGHRRHNPHLLFHHCTLEKPRSVSALSLNHIPSSNSKLSQTLGGE